MKKYYISLVITTLCFGIKAQDIHLINASNVMEVMKTMKIEQHKEVKNKPNTSRNVGIQIGENNKLETHLIDDQVLTLQWGNINSINYYDYARDLKSTKGNEMQIQLKGEANRAEIHGSNSISNGMSIEIIGNRSSIQVTNYK